MIRPANASDAREMGLLRRRACRIAYEGIVDPMRLDEPEDLDVWEQRVQGAEPGTLWVFEADGRVAGFAAAVPTAPEQPGVGFIRGLYVDPAAQGAGVGTALHDKVLDALREAGSTAVTTWVLADYERGRRFVEKLGW